MWTLFNEAYPIKFASYYNNCISKPRKIHAYVNRNAVQLKALHWKLSSCYHLWYLFGFGGFFSFRTSANFLSLQCKYSHDTTSMLISPNCSVSACLIARFIQTIFVTQNKLVKYLKLVYLTSTNIIMCTGLLWCSNLLFLLCLVVVKHNWACQAKVSHHFKSAIWQFLKIKISRREPDLYISRPLGLGRTVWNL